MDQSLRRHKMWYVLTRFMPNLFKLDMVIPCHFNNCPRPNLFQSGLLQGTPSKSCDKSDLQNLSGEILPI